MSRYGSSRGALRREVRRLATSIEDFHADQDARSDELEDEIFEVKGWVGLLAWELAEVREQIAHPAAMEAAKHRDSGEKHLRLGLLSEAVERFDAAIRLDPEDP